MRKVPIISKMSYEDRKKILNLPTMEERGIQGDILIIIYEFLGSYDKVNIDQFFVHRRNSKN